MKPPAYVASVLTWHYWATLIRLIISLAWAVMFIVFMAFGLYLTSILYSMPFLLMSINDILILTLDFKRTDSYVGTVLAQTILSALSLAPPATFMGLFGFDGPSSLAVYIPNSVHILCTLYLSVSLLISKREAGVHAPWKANTKDVLLGSSSQCHPSWFGHSRDPPLRKRDVSRFPHFWTVYVPKILFRRISPVESKRYAFFQNFCALLFIVAIIVRAIMALAQAQNQIETRSGAGTCNGLPYVKNLRVLVRHQDQDTLRSTNPQTGQGYDVAVQITGTGAGQYQCTSEPQRATEEGNWFQVFDCGPQNNVFVPLGGATYNITMHSTNGTSLDAIRPPDIWFANFGDTLQDTSALDQPGFMSNVAPWLVPPWQMIGGKHMEGRIDLVERRFITSSVFRDIVANLKPTYSSVSLFTIITRDTTPLTDNLTASALLTPSLVSSLSYLRDPNALRRTKQIYTSMQPVCAFIEDYRSSTIFDALGSVGGLLAILQGVHILLFGRPMFWGLTGAKLISPFGIFGGCHSRGFWRRLREQYHRQPTRGQTGDAAEAIRINTFLRDFVVDFGPADVDDEEDVETGRYKNREVHFQAKRGGSRGDDECDPNDSFLLLPRSKDRQRSQGSAITMETMSSTWGP